MDDTPACLPPPELRGKEGRHLLLSPQGELLSVRFHPAYPWPGSSQSITSRKPRPTWFFRLEETPEYLATQGYRYLCPADFNALAALVRAGREAIGHMEMELVGAVDLPTGTPADALHAALAPFAAFPKEEARVTI